MRVDRLALYTTVYPAVAQYLPAWMASVRAQTDQRFDLCIGIDAMTQDEAVAALGEDPKAQWITAAPGATPSGLRAEAIGRLAAEYDAVVFVDSDDLLHPERVAAARAALERSDVAACALRIMDESGRDLGIVFGPPSGEDAVTMLPRHNVFGLSNTAYRSSVLRECLPESPDTPLIDWLLATRAWALGATLSFDDTPLMSYRQYGANIARVLPPFTAADVGAATLRVLKHYECALAGAPALPAARRPALRAAQQDARRFHLSLAASAERRQRYVEALNRLPPRYVWWWCVANPELEDVWRS
jgi:hypothetical protein